MLTQKQIDERQKQCEKKGRHEWVARDRKGRLEVCANCGTSRTQLHTDAPVIIQKMKI